MRKLISCLLGVLCFSFGYAEINNYQAVFIPGFVEADQLRIAIRSFDDAGVAKFLIVNPYNLHTALIPATQLLPRDPAKHKRNGYFSWEKISNTPYLQLLLESTKVPDSIQNAGLTHALFPVSGQVLTVDMCPSIHATEIPFFTRLAKLGAHMSQGFPLAISISGLWLLDHPKDFAALLQWQQARRLQIIWVNHSFSHLYFPDLPLEQNFLLFQQTHLRHELLATEVLLLARHQLPSVFFRLPGLVANQAVLAEMRRDGLIPLGADAWLAKGQKPREGSIILVHGNGNEPVGIERVMPYLQEHARHWLSLYDIVSQQRKE